MAPFTQETRNDHFDNCFINVPNVPNEAELGLIRTTRVSSQDPAALCARASLCNLNVLSEGRGQHVDHRLADGREAHMR